MDPSRGPLFRHFIIIILPMFSNDMITFTPTLVYTFQKHQIITTSWKALYFYGFYFEAVTSTQKFANSFSKDPFLWTPPGGLYLGIL